LANSADGKSTMQNDILAGKRRKINPFFKFLFIFLRLWFFAGKLEILPQDLVLKGVFRGFSDGQTWRWRPGSGGRRAPGAPLA
jgi:hypothetical protein